MTMNSLACVDEANSANLFRLTSTGRARKTHRRIALKESNVLAAGPPESNPMSNPVLSTGNNATPMLIPMDIP